MVLLLLSRADTEPVLRLMCPTGEEAGGHGKLGGHCRTVTLTRGILQTI